MEEIYAQYLETKILNYEGEQEGKVVTVTGLASLQAPEVRNLGIKVRVLELKNMKFFI
ncbi:hypothetical protein NEISUBOT_05667 [Neisseria subflava NJ9703]|uniref:Uncharacterized protein n=1 Tax=Neisseria subflava NJ9703 TaxID=546268 RepID=A0A9W5INT0_NEISU|nr:hypothetical protein NEISUBOT_05667 [Neisseria subflava NJ9703]